MRAVLSFVLEYSAGIRFGPLPSPKGSNVWAKAWEVVLQGCHRDFARIPSSELGAQARVTRTTWGSYRSHSASIVVMYHPPPKIH